MEKATGRLAKVLEGDPRYLWFPEKKLKKRGEVDQRSRYGIEEEDVKPNFHLEEAVR